jgi:hypothetical protein
MREREIVDEMQQNEKSRWCDFKRLREVRQSSAAGCDKFASFGMARPALHRMVCRDDEKVDKTHTYFRHLRLHQCDAHRERMCINQLETK